MIDVQLILLGNENQTWLNQCQDGLNSPNVTIHQGQGIIGNINASRMAVWDSCGGTLLSSVDPDDIPSVDAWQELQDALDNNPMAMGAYTLETKTNVQGDIIAIQPDTTGKDPVNSPMVAHHILVVRRSVYDLVRPYAQGFTSGLEWMLAIAAFHQGGLICIPRIGYAWRRHPGNTSNSPNFRLPNNAGSDFLNWMWKQPDIIPRSQKG